MVTFLGDSHLPQVGLIQTNQVLNVIQRVVTLTSEERLILSQFKEAQEGRNTGLQGKCVRKYTDSEIQNYLEPRTYVRIHILIHKYLCILTYVCTEHSQRHTHTHTQTHRQTDRGKQAHLLGFYFPANWELMGSSESLETSAADSLFDLYQSLVSPKLGTYSNYEC